MAMQRQASSRHAACCSRPSRTRGGVLYTAKLPRCALLAATNVARTLFFPILQVPNTAEGQEGCGGLVFPTSTSPTRFLLDAAPNRGVERKKKTGPPLGPDVGRPTSVWDYPG